MVVWGHVCMHLPVQRNACWEDAHLCACIYGGQKSTFSVFLNHFPYYFWDSLTLNMELSGYTTQKGPDICLSALELRYTSQCWTFMWTLGIKLSSSCLCSKYFDDWAISPTPTYINNILGTLLALHHLMKTRILQVPGFRPISLTRKVKFQRMKVSCICSHSHLFIFLRLSYLLATFIVIYF